MKNNNYDLTVFDQKMSWGERHREIRRFFPSVETLDWGRVFRSDPAIMGRIVNDVLKIDQAEPGRPGKRPALNIERAEEKLRQIRGEDYTVLPFSEAVIAMRGDRSIRTLAYQSNLPKSTVHRLVEGLATPTLEQIEAIALGLKKNPSYFMEYRVAFILAGLTKMMSMAPESTIVHYKKIKGAVR